MKFSIQLFFLVFLSYTSLVAQDVFDIARNGSLKDIEEIYRESPETLEMTNENGYSPLVLSVYHGNIEVAQFLIDHIDNINEVSSYGTPLMAATVKGHSNLVKLLLESDADPNLTDAQGTSPLIYAAVFKLNDIAQLLIEYDADINHKDQKGYTPLDYASLTNNKELLTLLNKSR